MLQPADIASEVLRILEQAHTGKGAAPNYLTAYQILDRLSVRDQLVSERGMPGSGAGVYSAAANVVSNAIRHHMKSEVEIAYLDNVGICFDVGSQQIKAGYPVCGLYRLARGADAEV